MKAAVHEALSALFHPRAVAVLGVSEKKTKHNRIAFDNATSNGFKGNVYPIHRQLADIDGIKCYPTPADLPEQVDVVFMAIPAEAILEALEDCAKVGVKVAILGSAGFAESGEEGAKRQARLGQIVEEYGIRIVGPNCNGIYNANIGLSLGYNTAHAKHLPAGDVAVISHSGALFDTMMSQLIEAGAGLSFFVSAGNEADLDVLDYLEYAIQEEATKVIAMLLDSLSDGERLRALARQAKAAGKHIVALKIGRTEKGADAAMAHSSRLTSGPGAYEALMDACGIPLVSTLEGLTTAAAMLSYYGKVEGGLAVFSTSGAGAALLADLTETLHVPLTEFTPATVAKLETFRKFSKLGNPIDFGIFGERSKARDVPSIVAADPGVGMLMAQVHAQRDWQRIPTMAAITHTLTTSDKPFLILAPGGLSPGQREDCDAAKLRVFKDSHATLQGISAILKTGEEDVPPPKLPFVPAAQAELLSLDRPLTEPESLSILETFGIRTVASHVCASLDEAVSAAEKLGWPVVLKGVVPGLAHKSDAGLVRVDLRDAEQLRSAYIGMGSPENVVVQSFVKGDIEAIAGITRSPDVGPIMLVGLGGIYAEALKDITMFSVPASRATIEMKLAASPLGRVLQSPRWTSAKSFDTLIDTLLSLQALGGWAGNRIEAVDVNPLVIGKAGVVAVDGLIIPRNAKS